MGYARAQWRSGLTYEQVCDQCNNRVRYMDDKLDYRPWFADGFVYCPVCKKPLRHNEKYAINSGAQAKTADISHDESPSPSPEVGNRPEASLPNFCSGCGQKFSPNDRFCTNCGKKRE